MNCQQCKQAANWGEYASDDEKATGLCPDCLHKPFAVLHVTRVDMMRYLSAKKVGQVDEADMEYIARKIGDNLGDCYWDVLQVGIEECDWGSHP